MVPEIKRKEHGERDLKTFRKGSGETPHSPSGEFREQLHQPFDDPPHMADKQQHEQHQLDCYRQVRDQIQLWMEDLEKLISGLNQRAENKQGKLLC